ncbi:amidohydrolase family protein [Planotetraspora kaengkrachanensis]|uniref:Amidohydrolase n=1 Tax=Planotetraspora kaengkrachanensis TaxID=575193 RepID=A0A8J3PYC6_9ACTN|nr:amidohydrolase family protein [Planotetraspora kaengkrachanensis]GIG83374.1 amidohydrolase [Planotetraspora kaengkrachanensis]
MSRFLDAHVHLWNRATDPQPWIDPATMGAIDRDFAADDLERMLDSTGVDAAVVVQSSNSTAETRRLLMHPCLRIAGVVGWADLTADVTAQLDELDPAARRRLVGIRHLVHVDPDPTWLGRPDVGTGLEQLAARDLGFDLVVRSWQLPLAATVVAAHPGVRFVVDHLGGIAETDDDAGWEAGLREVATRPNTCAKISGLAGVVSGGDRARLRRVVDVALEAFGAERLMYGSDWPLAELGAGPVVWRGVVDELIGGLSPTERQAIMSGTASAFYGLGA